MNLSPTPLIAAATVEAASPAVVTRLDENFFRVRFDRLTPSEKRYLRAMADLGPGPHRTGDIAERLGVKVSSLGPVRAKLIFKGMVYTPAHGEMAFTVPLFDEFMIRSMPGDVWQGPQFHRKMVAVQGRHGRSLTKPWRRTLVSIFRNVDQVSNPNG